jgi:molecular chaperone GrpE
LSDKEKNTQDATSDDVDESSSPDAPLSDDLDTSPEDPAAPADDSDAKDEAPRSPTLDDLLARMADKSELNVQLTKQNQEQEIRLKELNEKWLRSAAEFENYRKRNRKEWELLKHQSKAVVILEILNVMDDFERAFAAAEEAESSGFVEGIRLIYNNLTQVMEKIGVRAMDAHHTPFDPNFHMAIAQIESEELDSGVVVEVVQKGYLLDDTVIRPANVIVAK